MSMANSGNTTATTTSPAPAGLARRAFLSTAASAGADTITAAVERHRIARSDLEAKLHVLGNLEKLLPKALRQSELIGSGEDGDEPTIVDTDDARYSDQIVICATAHAEEEDSFRSLFDIAPVSLAEGAALLRYFFEILETEEIFTRVHDESVQQVFLNIADLMDPRTSEVAA